MYRKRTEFTFDDLCAWDSPLTFREKRVMYLVWHLGSIKKASEYLNLSRNTVGSIYRTAQEKHEASGSHL